MSKLTYLSTCSVTAALPRQRLLSNDRTMEMKLAEWAAVSLDSVVSRCSTKLLCVASSAGSSILRMKRSVRAAKQRSALSETWNAGTSIQTRSPQGSRQPCTLLSSCASNAPRLSAHCGRAASLGSIFPHRRVTTDIAECMVSWNRQKLSG